MPQIVAFFALQEIVAVVAALALLTVAGAVYILPNFMATKAVRLFLSIVGSR